MKRSDPSGKDNLAARLTAYGAAAGAMILTAGNLSGQVAYSGIRNLIFDSPGILNPLDLNNDGVTEFNVGLAWDSHIFNAFSTYSAFIQNAGIVNGWIGTQYGVYQMSVGYNIDSFPATGFAPYRGFLGAGNAIMGIRFTSEGGTKGHYGWMRVNIDPFSTEFIVVDWAYNETHIEPIEAGVLYPGQIPPEPVLSTDESGTVYGDFLVRIDFSEQVADFNPGDIMVTGGSVIPGSLLTEDSQHFSAMIHPEVEGMIIIKIPGSCAVDDDGNLNMPGANRLYLNYLEVPIPVLSVDVEEPVEGPFTVELNFSEAVSGLAESDFVLTNCEIDPGSLVNNEDIHFSFTAVPMATGPVMIELPAGVVGDGDGHANIAAEALILQADFDSPRVMLSTDAAVPVTGIFTIDIEFSENVTGLAEYEIEVENGFIGAASLRSSGAAHYQADIIPAATGDVTIIIPADVARDEDEFGNLASEPLTLSAEIPSGTITARNTGMINCYPNPGKGIISLRVHENLIGNRIEILNYSGVKVYNSVVRDSYSELDLGGFPPGIYLVRITDNSDNFTYNLIIE